MVIKLFTTTFSTFNIIYNGLMYQLIFQEIMKIPRLATVIPNSFICCWSDVSKHLNQHTPFHNLSMTLIIIKVKVTFVRIVCSCYSSLNLPVSLISVHFSYRSHCITHQPITIQLEYLHLSLHLWFSTKIIQNRQPPLLWCYIRRLQSQEGVSERAFVFSASSPPTNAPAKTCPTVHLFS